MVASAKLTRRLFFASTTLFVVFCILVRGGPFRLLSPTVAELAGEVSTLSGILAWTFMCVAYGLQRKSSSKPSP